VVFVIKEEEAASVDYYVYERL